MRQIFTRFSSCYSIVLINEEGEEEKDDDDPNPMAGNITVNETQDGGLPKVCTLWVLLSVPVFVGWVEFPEEEAPERINRQDTTHVN